MGTFDRFATVPSTREDRYAPRLILDRLERFPRRHATSLVWNDDRTILRASRELDAGTRILIFDDTFTSGRHMLAAVDAIEEACAHVVGPVVIGRHEHSDYGNSRTMVEQLRNVEWDADTGARCGGVYLGEPFGHLL